MAPTLKQAAAAILVVAAAVTPADAACPNACSGHGTCGEYDACTCHSNFQGSDCSERVCMYHNAWVSTPQGDLNFDGDLLDGTIYSDVHKFATGSADNYLTTDAAAGGTWETWPSYHSQTNDEGHFYMECSNRGICDRASGLCQCFDGYEGTACRRMKCEKDCNGHGSCRSVNELRSMYQSGLSYVLWDGDMATTCNCDAGYQGPACKERKCPVGDDPLTATGQYNEVQIIDIYSTTVTNSGNAKGTLGGSSTFSYTDPNGATWTTDPVNIVKYDGPTTATTTMVAAVKAALLALPINSIPDVSVTAGFCEEPLPGTFVSYAATHSSGTEYSGATAPSATTYSLRCPDEVNGATEPTKYSVVQASDLEVLINAGTGAMAGHDTTSAVGGTMAAVSGNEQTCYLIKYPDCVRFTIEFTDNPGALPLLSVDTTSMTQNGYTNAQDNTYGLASVVTNAHVLTPDATAEYSYVKTSTAQTTSTDHQAVITGKTVTWTGGSTGNAVFPDGVTVEILCQGRSLGTYTVDGATAAGATLTVQETIYTDNSNCDGSTSGYQSQVKLVTEFLSTNVDLTDVDIVGKKITLSSGPAAGEGETMVVASTQWDSVNAVGEIFLEAGSGLSTSFASVARTLTIDGVGTKESKECGDRGVCDRDSGSCKCFKGYTGLACDTQNALAA